MMSPSQHSQVSLDKREAALAGDTAQPTFTRTINAGQPILRQSSTPTVWGVASPRSTTFVPRLAVGRVKHHRLKPREHRFDKKIRMIHYDVDRPESVLDQPLWARDWPAPMQVRDTDHLSGEDTPQGPVIRRLVQQRLGFWPRHRHRHRPRHRVTLLTQPRTWGWLFNPISIYFVWDETGNELDALVLEVTNTPWHERHQYVVDARDADRGTTPKALHVSPFMPMYQSYDFTWQTPGEQVTFGITVTQDNDVVFAASLHLAQEPLTRRKAVRTAISRPWATVGVSVGIHVQALKLWLKGVKFHRNPRKTQPIVEAAQNRESTSPQSGASDAH